MGLTVLKGFLLLPGKGIVGLRGNMFDKTIIDTWIDYDSFNKYIISIDDNNILYITERLPEVV